MADNEITVITPPDTFFPVDGPKIYLYGPNDEWKNELIGLIHKDWEYGLWGDMPITIYSDNGDKRNVNWLMTHLQFMDDIICSLETYDKLQHHNIFIIGMLFRMPNTGIILSGTEEKLQYIRMLSYNMTDNLILTNARDAFLYLKEKWTGSYE